jgi:hypothetical protein
MTVTVRTRAAVVARCILMLPKTLSGKTSLETAITDLLADEFADIQRQRDSDIRLTDE